MQIIDEYNHLKIPSYSLSYIINGDSSGLDETYISLVDKYLSVFENKAKEWGGHIIFGIETNQENFKEAEQLLIDDIQDVLCDKTGYWRFDDASLLRHLEDVVNLQKIKDWDKEEYFTWKPAFGLGCNVMECTILLVK